MDKELQIPPELVGQIARPRSRRDVLGVGLRMAGQRALGVGINPLEIAVQAIGSGFLNPTATVEGSLGGKTIHSDFGHNVKDGAEDYGIDEGGGIDSVKSEIQPPTDLENAIKLLRVLKEIIETGEDVPSKDILAAYEFFLDAKGVAFEFIDSTTRDSVYMTRSHGVALDEGTFLINNYYHPDHPDARNLDISFTSPDDMKINANFTQFDSWRNNSGVLSDWFEESGATGDDLLSMSFDLDDHLYLSGFGDVRPEFLLDATIQIEEGATNVGSMLQGAYDIDGMRKCAEDWLPGYLQGQIAESGELESKGEVEDLPNSDFLDKVDAFFDNSQPDSLEFGMPINEISEPLTVGNYNVLLQRMRIINEGGAIYRRAEIGIFSAEKGTSVNYFLDSTNMRMVGTYDVLPFSMINDELAPQYAEEVGHWQAEAADNFNAGILWGTVDEASRLQADPKAKSTYVQDTLLPDIDYQKLGQIVSKYAPIVEKPQSLKEYRDRSLHPGEQGGYSQHHVDEKLKQIDLLSREDQLRVMEAARKLSQSRTPVRTDVSPQEMGVIDGVTNTVDTLTSKIANPLSFVQNALLGVVPQWAQAGYSVWKDAKDMTQLGGGKLEALPTDFLQPTSEEGIIFTALSEVTGDGENPDEDWIDAEEIESSH